MTKTLFIINPISGGKDKSFLPSIINKQLGNKEYDIVYTQYQEHATELTIEGINNGYTRFIAVGGDGTVNEVAKQLINTDFELGIIPFGSGNGLARHNKIPLQIGRAIRLLNNAKVKRIDTCKLNNLPFISVSGVGFDAHIGKLFAENKNGKRGFSTYFNMTVNEFINYKPQKYSITVDGKDLAENAFLITFANSSQYGNNAYIAPTASMTDGMIDLCIMRPFPPLNILDLGVKLFTRSIHQSPYVANMKAKEIIVKREESGEIHLDGEPFESGAELKVEVVPNSLNLLVPHSLN